MFVQCYLVVLVLFRSVGMYSLQVLVLALVHTCSTRALPQEPDEESMTHLPMASSYRCDAHLAG